MPSYYSDPAFQTKLLAHVARDKTLLKGVGALLSPDDFKPPANANGDSGASWARWVISKLALDYWEKYRTPVRKLLRAEALDYAQKNHLGPRQQRLLLETSDVVRSQTLEAGDALRDKVLAYKEERAILSAVQQIIDLHEEGKISKEKMLEICRSVVDTFEPNGFAAVDFLSRDELAARMHRRAKAAYEDLPVFFIDPLDERIDSIRRKQIGVWLAPPGRGKSLACNHMAISYAMQGYHAVLFELEDPRSLVEDRIDAALTRMRLGMLRDKQEMFERRWHNVRRYVRGNLTIIDATEERCSVSWMESRLEELKERGKPADAVIVDYDDEVVSPVRNRDRRDLEISAMYEASRKLAAKLDLFWWFAAQTKSGKEKKKVLTDEDIGDAPAAKLRKSALMIGVGNGEEFGDRVHFLWVLKNKMGPKKFGVPIAHQEERGIFFDRERTQELYERLEAEREAEEADA